LEEKNIETIKTEEHLAILAVVGDGMRKQPGTAGKVLSVLGKANINIIAIAQGSSERNISLVLDESQVPSAVRHIHAEFQLTSLKEESP
jgi:aspartokinase